MLMEIDGYRLLHPLETVPEGWLAGLHLRAKPPARVLVEGWRIGMLALGCEDDTEPDRFAAHLDGARTFSHPDCLKVRDVGRTEDFLFAAYDYVLPFDGRSLLSRLAQRGTVALSSPLACTIAHRAALALHAIHRHTDGRRSALHGAIGLPNLWVTSDGGVRLVGLPDLGDRPRRFDWRLIPSSSPEALRGRAEPRSDVYSLAVAAWELLTGQPLAVEGSSDYYKMERVRAGIARDPREVRPEIPADVAGVVFRALSPDPAQRPADSAAFAAQLARAAFVGSEVPGPVPLAALIHELFAEEIVREAARWAYNAPTTDA